MWLLKKIPAAYPPGSYKVAFNPEYVPGSNGTGYPQAMLELYTYYMQCKFEVAEAIRKLVAGGAVQEYHVGSRGLKRYSLDELQNLLKFWSNLADDALSGGSAIKVRRAAPCDV